MSKSSPFHLCSGKVWGWYMGKRVRCFPCTVWVKAPEQYCGRHRQAKVGYRNGGASMPADPPQLDSDNT